MNSGVKPKIIIELPVGYNRNITTCATCILGSAKIVHTSLTHTTPSSFINKHVNFEAGNNILFS